MLTFLGNDSVDTYLVIPPFLYNPCKDLRNFVIEFNKNHKTHIIFEEKGPFSWPVSCSAKFNRD